MSHRSTLGRVVATVGALRPIEQCPEFPYLDRHSSGDWGNLCEEDRQDNERALRCGERLLPAYETPAGKLWILTEADRSATTILLPGEY